MLPHHQFPEPLNRYASMLLLEDVEQADTYLLTLIALLTILAFVQLKAFARPPPVPLKKLPIRPALSILFHPDDISSLQRTETTTAATTNLSATVGSTGASRRFRSPSGVFRTTSKPLDHPVAAPQSPGAPATSDAADQSSLLGGDVVQPPISTTTAAAAPATPHIRRSSFSGSIPNTPSDSVTGTDDVLPDAGSSSRNIPKPSFPLWQAHDLPDSFAPLLSSSQTELLLHHLTADLIHGVHLEGGIRMQAGRHEIPLDQDSSRPQLVLEVPKGGCRISVAAAVGSDGFSTAQDLDVALPTSSRSKPMVKKAGLVLDPPLPLSNVAPTLIHFPTLFEDNFVPTLRRIQIFRLCVDTIISISSFIEKVLWIIESFLQIHLSKVQITPLYRGRREDTTPDWRLRLAFSGHVLLCGWIPIPFINVVLPSFIIPQPHALLDSLLTKQPLASAKLRRDRINEQSIVLALTDTLDTWNVAVEVVGTPPAVGIDLTLPGGVSLGMEIMHGRDATAGRSRTLEETTPLGHNVSSKTGTPQTGPGFTTPSPTKQTQVPLSSGASMSSWTTNNEGSGQNFHGSSSRRFSSQPASQPTIPFNSNDLVPWKMELAAKGSVDKEKITLHLTKCSLLHEDERSTLSTRSLLSTRGSLAIWKASKEEQRLQNPINLRRTASFAHRAALAASSEESPSVASILLYPDDNDSFHHQSRMLQYDYAFDVSEDSKLDAITLSVGANHPMLNGGSMVTAILESIYAHGSVSAREHAILDPIERRRKRNILRHLPAIDFTFGIQNSFIPPESMSYTDDGLTRSLPEMDGGRINVRFIGGIEEDSPMDASVSEGAGKDVAVSEGIKVVGDFGFSNLVFNSETRVNEFPELDIFEGAKLRALTSGKFGGSVRCHLRPQKLQSVVSTTGPNIFNPLEAYEIDFSGSSVSARIKESSTSLGHRRIIIPTESIVVVKIVESVVDMSMEGNTIGELSWDFQGLSPILQVTDIGLSPENVMHEKKQQVSLLISALRQGRLNFHISPVGGIKITKAATSREDKEGLYDWKFFNALVSPDEESAERLLDVIHDKRTMEKLLQVTNLINKDAHRFLKYALTQIWRAKDIFDQEGVSDPAQVIPSYRMTRLMSLFICGDTSEVDSILPIVRKVVAGDGLDTVIVKELLRKHSGFYDEWAPEIDRLVRWLETMFNPFAVPPPYVENPVTPLSEVEHYSAKFRSIPSAAELYEQLHDRPHLPMDKNFSNMVGRLAPNLSFAQIEYFLRVRSSTDWQAADLKRLRYVYSVKRKVMEISENYGGLSFLPQSFLVSVFLGEATRSSLRVAYNNRSAVSQSNYLSTPTERHIRISNNPSTLVALRQRRTKLQDPYMPDLVEEKSNPVELTPAGRVASMNNFMIPNQIQFREEALSTLDVDVSLERSDEYELSDCLLGPSDVAILLQAGLTSVMKGSSVVQLNQRMLLDLIATQPNSFAVAVLAEIGTLGGQGAYPRGLASALMALLELDQSSFRPVHRLDMHALLESWLPGLKVPQRIDYMAGGRWARQSYYQALFSLATSILEDAECYMAMKSHLQQVRIHKEADPIPQPREAPLEESDSSSLREMDDSRQSHTLQEAITVAQAKIYGADKQGEAVRQAMISNFEGARKSQQYVDAVAAYKEAFAACARVRTLDKHAFHSEWFKKFYKRNYDALMIKSMYDNVINDDDNVRYWLHALRHGSKYGAPGRSSDKDVPSVDSDQDRIFLEPESSTEQELIDAIIDATIYYASERHSLKIDPLVRLLISNDEGKYDFTVVTAMGVITEGKAGLELQTALERLEKKRGVKTIRSDTATARSFEYNAAKIIEAIEAAKKLGKPFGYIGYSQGCANALKAETNLLSGTPEQRREIADSQTRLVCRQLLFSAANGSRHGPATDKKVQRLIVMIEEFFKYQQGYVSRALQSTFLDILVNLMDSAQFQKMMGGAQTFLTDGARAFWREAQHLSDVPTCTLRGVLEDHTTPESLEMISNMLTKQAGSELHDSQVHVFDAVGHPVYHNNRNAKILTSCDIGEGAIQRTHHWSPLNEEVGFVETPRDKELASFECAKDRHVFPWVDLNVRFGFVKYVDEAERSNTEEEESV